MINNRYHDRVQEYVAVEVAIGGQSEKSAHSSGYSEKSQSGRILPDLKHNNQHIFNRSYQRVVYKN